MLFLKGSASGAIGGARRDRTADLLRATQALSQLSYGPNIKRRSLHRLVGQAQSKSATAILPWAAAERNRQLVILLC